MKVVACWMILKCLALNLQWGRNVCCTRCKNLSGGRLRIAIARALFSSAKIVLLDDPSALDTKVAQFICRYAYDLCAREQRVLIVALQSTSIIPSDLDFRNLFIVQGRLQSTPTPTPGRQVSVEMTNFPPSILVTNEDHESGSMKGSSVSYTRASVVGQVEILDLDLHPNEYVRAMSVVSDCGALRDVDKADEEEGDDDNIDQVIDFADQDKVELGYIKFDILTRYFAAIGTVMVVLILM